MRLQAADGSLSPGPRAERRSLTSESMAGVWPDVERPLRRYLASMRLPAPMIDDVAQEVAVRVLARSVEYADAADLRRYCFRVARNIVVDDLRRSSQFAEIAERDQACLKAEAALHRVEDRSLLRTVGERLNELTPQQRTAVLAETPAVDRNRSHVARHRARKRLRVLVGPFAGVAATLMYRRRVVTQPMTLALVPVSVSLALLLGPTIDSGDENVADSGMRRIVVEQGSSQAPLRELKPSRGRLSSGLMDPTIANSPTTSVARPDIAVVAPADTHAALRLKENDGHQPLVCLRGDLIDACVEPDQALELPPVTVGP